MSQISIPIFPLNGVIVFPDCSLPLNIFEKKYVDMINYALSKNRLIGMIQTDEKSNLYKIGCLGKIKSFEEADDGRYMISLVGQNFYSVLKEVKTKHKFRLASVDILTTQNGFKKTDKVNFNRSNLLKNYKKYSDELNLKINFDLIGQVKDADLVKFIAMSSPFSPIEKQMLLETLSLSDIAEKLLSLFEFYSATKENKNIIN